MNSKKSAARALSGNLRARGIALGFGNWQQMAVGWVQVLAVPRGVHLLGGRTCTAGGEVALTQGSAPEVGC